MATSQSQTPNKLHKANVLVIGGTSGIGFAVAKGCLSAGSRVAVSSSQPKRVEDAVGRLRPFASDSESITGAACSLGDTSTLEASLESLLASLPEAFLPLDHVVFTAGSVSPPMGPSSFSADAIVSAGTVRLVAPLLLAKTLAESPQLLRPSPASSITFTSGASAERPGPGWTITAAYCAGIGGAVRGLARDMKPVRVNAVSPGSVMTEMWDIIPEDHRRAMWQELAKGHTTGEMGTPENVAEAYLYLMKDSFASGSIVHSNGGVHVL